MSMKLRIAFSVSCALSPTLLTRIDLMGSPPLALKCGWTELTSYLSNGWYGSASMCFLYITSRIAGVAGSKSIGSGVYGIGRRDRMLLMATSSGAAPSRYDSQSHSATTYRDLTHWTRCSPLAPEYRSRISTWLTTCALNCRSRLLLRGALSSGGDVAPSKRLCSATRMGWRTSCFSSRLPLDSFCTACVAVFSNNFSIVLTGSTSRGTGTVRFSAGMLCGTNAISTSGVGGCVHKRR